MGLSRDPEKRARQLAGLEKGRRTSARRVLESLGVDVPEALRAEAEPGQREKSPSRRAVERLDYDQGERDVKPRRTPRSDRSRRRKSDRTPSKQRKGGSLGKAKAQPPADNDDGQGPTPHVAEALPGFVDGALMALGLGELRRSR